MTNPVLRVFLVDDHPAVRQGLALLLEHNGMSVFAQSDSANAALQHLPSLAQEIDLAVVDLSFENDEGFDLIAALHALALPVVIYSMHEDSSHIKHGMACGASAYVSKREDSAILIHGILEASQNHVFLSPRAHKVMQSLPSQPSPIPHCSSREIQILQLLGQGMGCSEIAKSLTLSVRTVETYCARMNDKLELSGMKELRQFAIRHTHSSNIAFLNADSRTS